MHNITGPTGCAEDMKPQVPPGSQPQPAENAPGSFVQINNFPDGTYVSKIPQTDDSDKVFKPVELEEVSVKLTCWFICITLC